MAFVFDASVVLTWLLPDEIGGKYSTASLQAMREGAIAPALLLWEVENALLVAERRRRIDQTSVTEVVRAIRAFPIRFDVPALGASLALAREFNLSAYDAAYLAVALSNSVSLATLDAPLAKAAKRLGILQRFQ